MKNSLWTQLTDMFKGKPMQGKMKTRLLVSLILLSSIPVAIMGIASSLISNKIISEQTNQMHTVFLNQVESEMNSTFKRFDELMLQYTYSNTSLNRFTKDDLSYKNFQLTQDLFTILTNLRSGMENVTEIDFYSLPFKKVITSGGYLFDQGDFGDPLALQKAKDLSRYGTWLDTRLNINTRLTQPVITYIRPINNLNLNNTVDGTFFVYLDALALSNKLKAITDDEASYFVVNAKGDVMMHSDPKQIGQNYNQSNLMKELIKSKDTSGYRFTMDMDGKPSMINVVYSGNRDWYYVSSIAVSIVTKQTTQLRNILWGISLLFILLATVISIRTTRTIYLPLQKLTQRIFKQKDMPQTHDEIHSITEYISNVEESNESLKKDMDQYNKDMENYSILRLLLGNPAEREVLQGQFQAKNIALILIEVDQLFMESNYSRKDQFLFYYAIENITNEIFSKQGITKTILIQPGLFAVLNQADTEGTAISRKNAYELLHAIQTYLKLNCVISLSYSESGLHSIHDAYLQAKHALRYSFTLGVNKVIINDELDPAVSGEADALVEMENKILAALQALKYQESVKAFSQLIKLLKEDFSLTAEVLLSYFSQLLGAMIHSVKKQNSSLLESINMKNLTIELLKMRNLLEIEVFFHKELFERLNFPPQATIQSSEQKQIEKVAAYVQAHYDEDISLQICADLVGLSSFQLSRSFKKILGINFVDYVIQYRINVAKEMLADPSNTIQEVTDKLRYTSVNSFNRIFKKMTGSTPGNYRKEN